MESHSNSPYHKPETCLVTSVFHNIHMLNNSGISVLIYGAEDLKVLPLERKQEKERQNTNTN